MGQHADDAINNALDGGWDEWDNDTFDSPLAYKQREKPAEFFPKADGFEEKMIELQRYIESIDGNVGRHLYVEDKIALSDFENDILDKVRELFDD